MSNNFKHKKEQTLKVLTFCLFLLISVAFVNSVFTDVDNGSSHIVSFSEQFENGNDIVFSDVYTPNFNSLIFCNNEIDRLIKNNKKHFITTTNSKLLSAYDVLQRKYLNIKPTLLTVSNPILSAFMFYEDYPSVS